MDRRTIVCATLAVILLVAIAVSAAHLVQLREVEAVLSDTEDHLDTGSLVLALKTFRGLDDTGVMTQRQQDRRDELLLRTVREAIRQRNPIHKIDERDFDASRPIPYRFGLQPGTVNVSAELQPKELAEHVSSLQLGPHTRAFEGATAIMSVDLLKNGEEIDLPACVHVRLSDGTEREVPIPGRIRLVQDASQPSVEIAVEGEAPRKWNEPDPNASVVVPPGRGVRISVKDALGLHRVKWSYGSQKDNPHFDPEAPLEEYFVRIPPDLWGRQSSDSLEIEAENRVRNGWTFSAVMDVKGRSWFPVTDVRLGNVKLHAHRSARAGGTQFKIRLALLADTNPRHVGIAVRMDGRDPIPLLPHDGFLEAAIHLPANQSTGLSLVRNNTTLKTYLVATDTRAPTVTVTVEATGKLLPPGSHKLPPGAVVSVRIKDSAGVPSDQDIRFGTMKLLGKTDLPKEVERRLALGKGDQATISVVGRDSLANQGSELQWTFQVAKPLRIINSSRDGNQAEPKPTPMTSSEEESRTVDLLPDEHLDASVRRAQKGLPGGTLEVPTPKSWPLGSGQAIFFQAAHPAGIHPGRRDLEGTLVLGERGGAAFEYMREKLPKPSGSYAEDASRLVDMAKNVWELVREGTSRRSIIGGSLMSSKKGCRFDGQQPAAGRLMGITGLRLMWKPKA